MRDEKYCMSCAKWRDKASGKIIKTRNTNVWRCGFCLEMRKQKAQKAQKVKAAA